MIENKLVPLLDIAKNAAISAGYALKNDLKLARKVHKSSNRDIKIYGDILSENIIVETLRSHSSFPILSEESGIIGEIDKEEYLWILDPIDGSLNFSQGIPLCCISIAFWKSNNPILGVIFDFYRNELFSGIIGEGAWLNGTPISTSQTNSKKKAILCAGFPIRSNFSDGGITNYVKQVQTYKKVRHFGTAALSLAYVACGRVDAYFEENIMIWDVGAGCAIVTAAGGKVLIENCDDLSTPKNVLASNCFIV